MCPHHHSSHVYVHLYIARISMSPLSCFLALLLSYISFYSTFCMTSWYIFHEFPRENSCLIDVDWTESGERVGQSTASMSPSSSNCWHTSATRGRGPHATQVKLHQHVVTHALRISSWCLWLQKPADESPAGSWRPPSTSPGTSSTFWTRGWETQRTLIHKI